MVEARKNGQKVREGAKAADVLPWPQAKAMGLYALGARRWTAALAVALGAGMGLRASDIPSVRWADVVDPSGRAKVQVQVRERKNKRVRTVFLAKWAREIVEEAYKALRPTDLNAPVVKASRQRLWLVVKGLAEDLGYQGRITPHSLRKSFCDHVYSKTRDPVLAARMTGHANPSHLLRYIGRLPAIEERIWQEIASED